MTTIALETGGAETQSADVMQQARPNLHRHAHEVQPYGRIVKLPIALSEKVCATSVELLNQILADTMTLRDMYKKHHWQVAGPTFFQLHLLYDKHYKEQVALVDAIAERVQLLGGVSIAMAADVAETNMIARPPRGREGGARAVVPAAGSARNHHLGHAQRRRENQQPGRLRHQRHAGGRCAAYQ